MYLGLLCLLLSLYNILVCLWWFSILWNLSDINIATPIFFWLMFSWYIFFHTFICLYFYIWSEFLIDRIYWVVVFNILYLCLLICGFRLLSFNVIIDILGLKLSTLREAVVTASWEWEWEFWLHQSRWSPPTLQKEWASVLASEGKGLTLYSVSSSAAPVGKVSCLPSYSFVGLEV